MVKNSSDRQDTVPDASPATSDAASSSKADAAAPVTPQPAHVPDRAHQVTSLAIPNRDFPTLLRDEFELFQGSDGHAYLHRARDKRLPVLRVGTKSCNAFLRSMSQSQNKLLNSYDLREINEDLTARAELSGDVRAVWYRVAPIPGGCEIDLGDAAYTRVRLTAGEVSVIAAGSGTLFFRTSIMKALPLPAEVGDVRRLHPYLNLHPAERFLLTAWIIHILGHAKQPTTNFPILVLLGDHGSGKSVLCRIVQALIDPNEVLLRTFPRNGRDLAVAARDAHLVLCDNMGDISRDMSNQLCMTATGGSFATRRLYSDADEVALNMQVGLVLNAIASPITAPDLAQRSLQLTLLHIDERARRDEAAMFRQFAADLPVIFRGLLDRVAGVLANLPEAEVTHPERMFAFSHWLAAMERLDGLPAGVYQGEYSAALTAGMRDSLESNPVAVAVMGFVDGTVRDEWSGTPKALLQELTRTLDRTPPDWPRNEIALSKQLRTLKAGLARQGVDVRIHRSHTRLITITRRAGGAA